MEQNDYEKEYYERCKAKGIDYAFYGDWQRQYAKLIIFMCEIYMMDYKGKVALDIGTACGANLRAFKETGMFDKLYGIDISNYLITLGRESHNLSENELYVGDCTDLGYETDSIDFIHCSQLLEHMNKEDIQKTIDEMYRVLKTNGKIFITLDAVQPGRNKKTVLDQDPTHITAEKYEWWHEKLASKFIVSEREEVDVKFFKGKFHPGPESDIDPNKKGDNKRRTFYDHYANEWTVFILKGK